MQDALFLSETFTLDRVVDKKKSAYYISIPTPKSGDCVYVASDQRASINPIVVLKHTKIIFTI